MQPTRFSALKECFRAKPFNARKGKRKAGLGRGNEIRRRKLLRDLKERTTESERSEVVAAVRNDALRRMSVRHLRPLS